MSIWDKRGSLMENPYYRTAFRVARVPREMIRRKEVVDKIRRTRQIVIAIPGEHTIAGQAVTQEEVNKADDILMDPQRRFVEELLVHAAEEASPGYLRQLANEIAGMLADPSPAPVANLDVLRPWAELLVRQCLESQDGSSGPALSLGALELDIAPPFGHSGESNQR